MSGMDLGSLLASVKLDIADFNRGYDQVDRALNQLAQRTIPDIRVGANTMAAEQSLRAVDDLLSRELNGANAEVTATADTTQADTDLSAIETFMSGVLDGMEAEVSVAGDTSRADAALVALLRQLSGLEGEGATVDVDADTSAAESALDGLAGEGEEAGAEAGEGMSAGIKAGLAAIPIGGGLALIGVAIGKALLDGVMDGLNQEATRDLFSARTGLDEATAERFGRAAGNAYSQAWGDSVEENLDAARLAYQGGIIDADATTAEVEEIIASLDGVTTILDEDMPGVVEAVSTLLRTGLAPDADHAFDLLVTGAQTGANRSQDLLDTLNEYPVSFEQLGLDGETALGLISQAMENGARDTDYAADALKEFGIRAQEARDDSSTAAAGFERLGLDAEDMASKVAAGGDEAEEALRLTLDRLREIEDPVERNAAAVELFGTQAENLGDALYAMDVDTAVSDLEELGDVAGRAEDALSTLGDNGATSIESAKRSIEVSADGIKGTLASALEDPLSNLATWVSSNRAGVLDALGGIVNAMFDLGRMGVEAVAGIIEAFGDFAGVTIPAAMNSMRGFLELLNSVGLIDFDMDDYDAILDGLKDVRWDSYNTAEALRTNVIDNGLDPIQDRFNEGLDTEKLNASVHDATTALSDDISAVGEHLEDLNGIEVLEDGTFDTGTDGARELDEQISAAVDSMHRQEEAARTAGESQGELTARWGESREALIKQIEALTGNREEAEALADTYGAVPTRIETSATLFDEDARHTLNGLVIDIDASEGTVTVDGDRHEVDDVLGNVLDDIFGSKESVVIGGRRFSADETLEDLLAHIERQRADLDIGATTTLADSAFNAFIDRHTGRTISVNARIDPRMSNTAVEDGGLFVGGTRYADGGYDAAGQYVARESQFGGPKHGKRWITWGEDVTNWELYLSGKPGMEEKNKGYLRQVAPLYGLDVVDAHADGGWDGNMAATLDIDADVSKMAEGVVAAAEQIAKQALESGLGGSGGPAGGRSADLVRFLKANFPDVRITSTFRPGAVTSTGYPSKHGQDLAVDWVTGNMARDALRLEALMGKNLSENYSSNADLFTRYGKRITPAFITRLQHWDHNHSALEDGGFTGDWDGALRDLIANAKVADVGEVDLDPGANLVVNGLGRQEHLGGGLDRSREEAPGYAPVDLQAFAIAAGEAAARATVEALRSGGPLPASVAWGENEAVRSADLDRRAQRLNPTGA